MYVEYLGYDSILAIHATMYLTRLVAVCVIDAFLSRDLLSNTVGFAVLLAFIYVVLQLPAGRVAVIRFSFSVLPRTYTATCGRVSVLLRLIDCVDSLFECVMQGYRLNSSQ